MYCVVKLVMDTVIYVHYRRGAAITKRWSPPVGWIHLFRVQQTQVVSLSHWVVADFIKQQPGAEGGRQSPRETCDALGFYQARNGIAKLLTYGFW